MDKTRPRHSAHIVYSRLIKNEWLPAPQPPILRVYVAYLNPIQIVWRPHLSTHVFIYSFSCKVEGDAIPQILRHFKVDGYAAIVYANLMPNR